MPRDIFRRRSGRSSLRPLLLLVLVPLLCLPKHRAAAFVPAPRLPSSIPATALRASDGEDLVDPVVQLPLWEAQLASAGSEPEREELLGRIDDARSASELGVRRAQVEFYDAFSAGSASDMERIWSKEHADECQCIHPGSSALVGRQAVLGSWRMMFAGAPPGAPPVVMEPSGTTIDVCGSTAICRCVESARGSEGRLEALNVYKRENGAWKMTLHMAFPILEGGPDGPGGPGGFDGPGGPGGPVVRGPGGPGGKGPGPGKM